MLVINLEVRDSNVIAYVGRLSFFDSLEEIFACPGNQTRTFRRTHHGITLPRSSLAVGEYARVVSFKVVIQELLSEAVVDVLLVGIMLI
jgi:hypothetical protein